MAPPTGAHGARRPPDATAWALTTALCLVWGSQQVVIKLLAPAIAPVLQIGARSVPVALLLLAWLSWQRRGWPLPRRSWAAGVLAGLLFGVEFIAIAEALRHTSAGHVVVFLYTAPLFTAIGLHGTVAEERLSRRQWLALGCALGGIALAFGGQSAEQHNSLRGDAIALLAGAAWGAATVVVRASALAREPPVANMCWQMLFTAAMCLAYAALCGQWRWDWVAATRGAGPLLIAWQLLAIALLSYLGWFWLLDRYRASRIAAMALMTPLFGVLLGVWLLGESPQPGFMAGAALVSLGLLLLRLGER